VWRRLRRCASEPGGPKCEPLEKRCLLSGLAGFGDVNPNDIRVGQAIVVDVDQSSFTTIERAAKKFEIAKRDADGQLLWANLIKTNTAPGTTIPLALAGDGGVIVAATFKGTIDVDPTDGVTQLTAAKGRKAMLVAKYDADGELVWATSMTGKGTIMPAAIAVDDQQIIVTGSFSGTINFDPGASDASVKSAGSYDIAIMRFDGDGQWLGAQQIGGKSDDRAYDVAIDASGRAYVVGRFGRTIDADPGAGVLSLTTTGSYDGLVMRFDAWGTLEWAGRIGGKSDDAIKQIVVGQDGQLFLAGHFSKTADLDPTSNLWLVKSAGGRDPFITSITDTADFVWAGALGAKASQYAPQIAPTADGGLLLTSRYVTNMDLDPGPDVLNIPAGKYGICVLRLDALGSPQWGRWIGGGRFEDVWDIATDPLGNTWTLGNTLFKKTDFDPGPDVLRLNDDGVFLHRLDPDGNFIDVLLI
jgi:hypothetical protein